MFTAVQAWSAAGLITAFFFVPIALTASAGTSRRPQEEPSSAEER